MWFSIQPAATVSVIWLQHLLPISHSLDWAWIIIWASLSVCWPFQILAAYLNYIWIECVTSATSAWTLTLPLSLQLSLASRHLDHLTWLLHSLICSVMACFLSQTLPAWSRHLLSKVNKQLFTVNLIRMYHEHFPALNLLHIYWSCAAFL